MPIRQRPAFMIGRGTIRWRWSIIPTGRMVTRFHPGQNLTQQNVKLFLLLGSAEVFYILEILERELLDFRELPADPGDAFIIQSGIH